MEEWNARGPRVMKKKLVTNLLLHVFVLNGYLSFGPEGFAHYESERTLTMKILFSI